MDGKLPLCRADVTIRDWVSSRLQEEEDRSYSVPYTPSLLHKEQSSQGWGVGWKDGRSSCCNPSELCFFLLGRVNLSIPSDCS